jgi:hypothetical protein
MATPIFCCGAECGVAGNAGQHLSTNAALSVSTTTVRSGDRSWRFNPSASAFTCTVVAAGSASDTVLRFYIRFATLPSADTLFCWVGTGSNIAGVGFRQSDSKIYCGGYGTGSLVLTTTSGVAVTTGTWYRIDARIQNNAEIAFAQVDGTAVTQHDGSASGSSTATSFGSTATVSGDWFIDDIVISTTGADYPIGAGYVNHFVPTADGTHNVAG